MRRALNWVLGLGTAATLAAAVIAAAILAIAVHQARGQVDVYFPDRQAGADADLSLADLSEWQIEALLVVEDPGFRSHSGIDLATPGAGITTITQALVKRTFMRPFRPGPWNKLEQSAIARFALDPAVSKERQLEAFLDITYFGEAEGGPVIGFAAAARQHFSTSFAELDRRQYLSLVAMLIAPNALRPDRHGDALRDRVSRIETLLSGGCQPEGLRDVWLTACGER